MKEPTNHFINTGTVCITHYSDVTWASCHIKSLPNQQFAQQFVQANINKYIKNMHN